MSLNEFIARLEVLRAQHGGAIEVWVSHGAPTGPLATVREQFNGPHEPPLSLVLIE